MELRAPRTRGECRTLPRPCPFTRCPYHLAADFTSGAKAPRESCVLDVADRGGATLAELAAAVGLNRSRIQQLERVAIEKLRAAGHGPVLADLVVPFSDGVVERAGSVGRGRNSAE